MPSSLIRRIWLSRGAAVARAYSISAAVGKHGLMSAAPPPASGAKAGVAAIHRGRGNDLISLLGGRADMRRPAAGLVPVENDPDRTLRNVIHLSAKEGRAVGVEGLPRQVVLALLMGSDDGTFVPFVSHTAKTPALSMSRMSLLPSPLESPIWATFQLLGSVRRPLRRRPACHYEQIDSAPLLVSRHRMSMLPSPLKSPMPCTTKLLVTLPKPKELAPGVLHAP